MFNLTTLVKLQPSVPGDTPEKAKTSKLKKVKNFLLQFTHWSNKIPSMQSEEVSGCLN